MLAVAFVQANLQAGITKVDCPDGGGSGWPMSLRFSLCLPCRTKPCVPFSNGNFGYYPAQWTSWPGTMPNGKTAKTADGETKSDGSKLHFPKPMEESKDSSR
jgi:hypothetical protein